MKNLLVLLLIFLAGCSATIVRDEASPDEFYKCINNICRNRTVLVTMQSGNVEEGEFVKIDKDATAIQTDSELRKIPTDDVLKIKYNRGFSPSGMAMGTVMGFALSIFAIQMADLRIDVGGGGSGDPFSLLLVPALTIGGAFVGAFTLDKYDTIILKENENRHAW